MLITYTMTQKESARVDDDQTMRKGRRIFVEIFFGGRRILVEIVNGMSLDRSLFGKDEIKTGSFSESNLTRSIVGLDLWV